MGERTVNTAVPSEREEWRPPTMTRFEADDLTEHFINPGTDGIGYFSHS
jgi:hypothetical protein